jgi:hypothetical protein
VIGPAVRTIGDLGELAAIPQPAHLQYADVFHSALQCMSTSVMHDAAAFNELTR